MRIVVADDFVSVEQTISRALEDRGGAARARHEVVGVRSPQALQRTLAAASFDLAFVDMDFGRGVPDSGLVALRYLDEAGVKAVVHSADSEDNRVLFLLAAFQFYEPVDMMSKSASDTEIRRLVDLIELGGVPDPAAFAKYRQPRYGPSLLDRLIGNRTDLKIWTALSVHSGRPEVARAAYVSVRRFDKFLSSRFEAMRAVEELLGSTIAQAEELGAAGNQARLAPLHAFAVTHAHFFRDPEVPLLIEGQDRPPRRRP